jgi:hypothetical protein
MIGMPDDIARKYAVIVKRAARKVHARWPYALDRADVEHEAWLISIERYSFWEAGMWPAHTDLAHHLRNRAQAMLRAQGWTRKKVGGVWTWISPAHREFAADPFRLAKALGRFAKALGQVSESDLDAFERGFSDAELDHAVTLATDWPTMTWRDALAMADILIERYPKVAVAFMLAEQEVKPSKMSHERWTSGRAKQRALLRVKYRNELAFARYEAEFGSLPANVA